jgi:hypothetical protein
VNLVGSAAALISALDRSSLPSMSATCSANRAYDCAKTSHNALSLSRFDDSAIITHSSAHF